MTTQASRQKYYARYFPGLKRALTRKQYDYVSELDVDGQVRFMNYGYASREPAEMSLRLPAEYEQDRYQVLLYEHIAKAVSWKCADVLEMGCGRGGGASYLVQKFKPQSFIGVDMAPKAIDFCQRNYAIPRLRFEQGDAERMRFADHSFDIVLNVESSLYYPRVGSFLSEVARVLRPSGHFLYADIRYWEELCAWRQQLRGLKLDLIYEEDITPQVVKALDLDYERKRNLISQYVPRLLWGPFGKFAGVTGAGFCRGTPRNGERIYRSFVFRKPA